MQRLQDFPDDLKTLIGEQYPSGHIFLEQECEIASLLAEGYGARADEVIRQREELAAWNGAREFNGILLKKHCEHTSCPHFRCERGLRIGGIEI